MKNKSIDKLNEFIKYQQTQIQDLRNSYLRKSKMFEKRLNLILNIKEKYPDIEIEEFSTGFSNLFFKTKFHINKCNKFKIQINYRGEIYYNVFFRDHILYDDKKTYISIYADPGKIFLTNLVSKYYCGPYNFKSNFFEVPFGISSNVEKKIKRGITKYIIELLKKENVSKNYRLDTLPEAIKNILVFS